MTKRLLLLGLSSAFLAMAAMLLWPRPARNVFGDAAAERLLSECVAPAVGAGLKLYRGEGPGGAWWSVSATLKGQEEAQVFYSFVDPEIRALHCEAEQARLELSSGESRALAASDLERMAKAPV